MTTKTLDRKKHTECAIDRAARDAEQIVTAFRACVFAPARIPAQLGYLRLCRHGEILFVPARMKRAAVTQR